jgi:outer membrane protein assembly factor BamB
MDNMANFDITGEIAFTSSASENEILETLISAFQSSKISTDIQENKQLTFTVPFLISVRRGHRFQGIASGLVEAKSNANVLTLQYRLVPLPLTHIFIAIMLLWVAIGMPWLANYAAGTFNIQAYLTFNVPAMVMIVALFLVSRLFIKYKFRSFLKRSLSGKYAEIKRPAWKSGPEIKKIALISCSSFLLLAILVPLFVFLNIWNTRSRVVWQYPIRSDVMAAPLILDGVVYVGSIGDAERSAFYSLASDTGKELWVKPLGGGVRASPVFVESMICFGTEDGLFQCLDRQTGDVRWAFGPEQRNLDANECDRCALKLNTPLFDEGIIYVGSLDHNLYALDVSTGQLIWSFRANGSIFEAPAMDQGILYVGSQDGNVYALDGRSGREIKQFSIPERNDAGEESGVYGTPIVDEGTLYAVNGTLSAVDIQTGAVKWQVLESSKYEDQIIGNPILFEDHIIVTTVENIYAVDKFSGKTDWKYSGIKGGVFFTPTLFEDAIYFGDLNGHLHVVNARTGRRMLRYNMSYLDFASYTNYFPDLTFPPATDGKVIYVKWLDHLYAMRGQK